MRRTSSELSEPLGEIHTPAPHPAAQAPHRNAVNAMPALHREGSKDRRQASRTLGDRNAPRASIPSPDRPPAPSAAPAVARCTNKPATEASARNWHSPRPPLRTLLHSRATPAPAAPAADAVLGFPAAGNAGENDGFAAFSSAGSCRMPGNFCSVQAGSVLARSLPCRLASNASERGLQADHRLRASQRYFRIESSSGGSPAERNGLTPSRSTNLRRLSPSVA